MNAPARLQALCSLVALLSAAATPGLAGPFDPAAGQPGSRAVSASHPSIVAWATGFTDLVRGPLNAANPGLGNASFGAGANATGPSDATGANPTPVVSLGDGGRITLTFANPIVNRTGFDFVVFENGFADNFLELAFVEASSDGVNFVRFPAQSLTQTVTQIGAFDPLDPTNLDNLAGKYRAGFGTPFQLDNLTGNPLINTQDVRYIRIVDVVGSLNPAWGSTDSHGRLVNDPFPTAFASGGFDLDAVGVIHQAPEPATWILLASGALALYLARRKSCSRRPL